MSKKRVQLMEGDCLDRLRRLEDASVDSIVTDPPYGLAFMGKSWDKSLPGIEHYRECLRVLKPGGHLLAFGGSRTYHRTACTIEDAGFEIRDCIMWIYGSGFPKSLDVSKAIDKAAGAEREVVGTRRRPGGPSGMTAANGWNAGPMATDDATVTETAPATDDARQWAGWGTALKPAHEPIVMARKPIAGTVAANVLKHGTGAMNIDGCRVGSSGGGTHCNNRGPDGRCFGHPDRSGTTFGLTYHAAEVEGDVGRWPANVIHDGSACVVEAMPNSQSKRLPKPRRSGGVLKFGGENSRPSHGAEREAEGEEGYNDQGSAARFFYCAKASKAEREAGVDVARRNNHPTVKPVALMRYLCRLVTPPDGVTLDPFMGSGTTGVAAVLEGFRFVGIEREAEYCAIAQQRIRGVLGLFGGCFGGGCL